MVLFLVSLLLLPASEPCRSGPAVGQKFGPYTFLLATGPKRGTSHCYVCETGPKPAVLVFAKQRTSALGDLLVDLDGLVTKHQGAELAGWVTFLSADQPAEEPKLAEWGKQLGLRNLPLGIFEDEEGPTSYRLNPEAEVTVLLVKGGKVAANFAFRKGELKGDQTKPILDAVAALVR